MVKKEMTVHAPIDVVYDVIRNFEAYPDFLSTTHSAKERSSKSEIDVDFTIDVVKTIRYCLKFECDPPHGLTWSLVEGDLMKKNNGAWKLTALGPDKTKAVYQIDIDFGWLVPKMIIEQVTKVQLPETLQAFRERAEALALGKGAKPKSKKAKKEA